MATHPFTLRQLQYVVAVADTLGFRRAAEACHVSQPSLSAQLAHVEDALGVKLFERDRRRVLPTAAGRVLIERARQVLTAADDLVHSARALGDPLRATLRVGVIPTISPYLLPETMRAIRSKLGGLTVLWIEERTEVLLRDLHEGRIDGALLAIVPGLGDVETLAIAEDRFVLAGAAGNPLLRGRRSATPADLEGEQVLLLEDGHCFRDQVLAICARAHAGEGDFRATSLATLAQVVAGGAGVTLLPELSLAVENRRGELAIRRFAEPAPRRRLALIWRRNAALAVGLRALGETIRAAYPKTTGKGGAPVA